MSASLSIKRVYDTPSPEDGYRILVDRLWPRGLSKERASVDLWLKDIAPSTKLREWFGHDPVKWPGFKERYAAELQQNAEAVSVLSAALKRHKRVTLLYGARDTEHNDAVVLFAWLRGK